MTPARRYLPALATLLLTFLVLSFLPPVALATCAAPKNAIEAENCLPGTPASQWYVDGSGSSNIQGFTTDISVNVGQTIFFKISTPAASYRIDIYRMGFYQGNDGRFITSISPSVSLPQIQPPCLSDSSTGLVDCGNWGISASWTVPSTATSGIYYARLLRLDTGEASPVIFVVRNDSSHSDILVQTSDPTWQAYNAYGGNSFYSGNPVGRAYKVSYNRPVNAGQSTHLDFFSFEYEIVRFLEANGYDLTYFTGVDTDRNGALITQHKVFMSVGHDEYWSGGQRANVEAARDAAVNLVFFSGNEVFWKTRWEASTDGTNTPYRTLVCYKETSTNGSYGGVIDPADPPIWTGFWRDTRFSPPADGGRPENALTGTMSQVSAPQNNAITVPQDDGRMRFWRNTSIATLGPGQVATLPQSTLGYESDEDVDNGFRPAGLIHLSTTTVAVSQYLYFSPASGYYFGSGTETHHLTLYRARSGALVFGAGTILWSWGVDSDHAGYTGLPADPNMRQANVNLLADMGAQPATLQMGLVSATASTDTTPPRSTIMSPAPGTTVTAGSQVTVSGTAQDSGGGVVGGVEVSVDGGATWHPAVGRENWSYVFTAANSGTLNVQSRAVDDSGNLEAAYPTITTQPTNQTVTAGQMATFTAAATGSPTPTVQWQVSTDGGATFSNVSGATSTTLSFTTALSQNGNQYRAVFTNSAGTATTTTATLTVNSPTPPTITTQPASQTVSAGQTATFTAAATGSPTPTVQWQVSTDAGATFSNVSGATFTTLSFTTALSQNANQYRAVFTNSAGTATTTAATLTVNNSPTLPTITTQPTNQTVTAGQTATFTAAATGSPTPTVQWQVSTDAGGTFSNLSGATSTTLSFTTALSQNGNRYRAVFTNSAGTATTTAATLTVNAAPPPSGTVTLQNTNSNLCIDTGGSANFTALIQSACSTSNTQKFSLTAAPASGWYYLVSAASNLCWDVSQGSVSAGALIQQYTCVAVPPEYYQLKAVSGGYQILSANMTNGCLDVVGASTTSGAKIEQNTCIGSANQIFNIGTPSNTTPTITTQPTNQTLTVGQTATFTAAATGSPTPTVQWQVSTDGGGTFSNVSAATSTTLSFTTASSQNGNRYRAVFTNSAGTATTTTATLTVNSPTPPTITTQPASQTVSAGQTATFTAAATGSPTPTVQWQVSTDGGVTFSNVSGATSTTLSFTTTLSQNGNQYRVVFTNAAGTATTTAATLTVNNSSTPPTITTQPGNQTVTAGQTATFTAAATGSPTPTVQWQVSTDGGVTFSNVSGATSTTLSFTTASSQNGNRYRAVFTNSAGTATTTAATLTVNAAPPPSGTVTLQNTNSNLCIDTGGSANFTALIQSACSASTTQKFSLTAAPASGWYYLVSAASNLCWDVTQGSSSAGALIQQYTCVAVPPEYYQLKAVSGGYEILSQNMSNGCLDVVGGSTASGAHIEQNTCIGSANQIFNIR